MGERESGVGVGVGGGGGGWMKKRKRRRPNKEDDRLMRRPELEPSSGFFWGFFSNDGHSLYPFPFS